MKYMMLIYSSPSTWAALSEEDRERMYREHGALHAELVASGEWQSGNALAGPERTTTVRVRQGEVLATDGPFAEVKEHLAGYDVIECATYERAVQIASRIPDARVTRIELRPIISPGEK